MPIDPEFRRIDATTKYTLELDHVISTSFPYIDSAGILAEYIKGKYPFIQISQNSEHLRAALATALKLSKDKGAPQYCEHADKSHTVFVDAVDILSHQLLSSKNMRLTPSKFIVSGSDGDFHASTRFVLTAEPILRRTLMPPAYVESKTFGTGMNDKGLERLLRQIADEKGKEYATLVGLYKGITAEKIFDILQKRDDNSNRYPLGNKRRILTTLREIDEQLLGPGDPPRPKYGREPYENGLSILLHSPDFTDKLDSSLFSLQPVDAKLVPIAVFEGMDKIAHLLAPQNLLEPQRTKYISAKYGNRLSSKVVTVYLADEIGSKA